MVRSHKFCCCLPVRLGAFVLSLFQFLFCGATAALIWYALLTTDFGQTQKIIASLLGSLMTILFLGTFLGFIGSIMRQGRFMRIYSVTLKWLLGVNIALGIAAIVILFMTNKQTLINDCINGSTDVNVINACNNVDTYRFVAVGFLVLGWAIQLYACIVVASYVRQLQEEKEESWRLSSMKSYMQVSARDSTDAFVVPEVLYPFSGQNHSYGADHKV